MRKNNRIVTKFLTGVMCAFMLTACGSGAKTN